MKLVLQPRFNVERQLIYLQALHGHRRNKREPLETKYCRQSRCFTEITSVQGVLRSQ